MGTNEEREVIYSTGKAFSFYISAHFVLIGEIHSDEILCANSSGKYGLVGPGNREGLQTGNDINNVRVRNIK